MTDRLVFHRDMDGRWGWLRRSKGGHDLAYSARRYNRYSDCEDVAIQVNQGPVVLEFVEAPA